MRRTSPIHAASIPVEHTKSGKAFRLARALVPFILFGFLSAFKPSEAFISPYLRTEKRMSHAVLHSQVWPVWTYANTFWLVLFIPMTMFLGSYISIAVGIVGRLLTRVSLIWGDSKHAFQLAEFFFGCATASEYVFYGAVFSHVDTGFYPTVSSLTRASVLAAHLASALLGQLLVSCGVPYHILFYISLLAIVLSATSFLTFPGLVPTRIPFSHTNVESIKSSIKKSALAIIRPAARPTRALVLVYAVGLAVHSLAVAYFSIILDYVDPALSLNGLAIAVIKVAGVAGAWASSLPVASTHLGSALFITSGLGSVMLWVAAWPIDGILPRTVALVIDIASFASYNFFAECVIALTTAHLAKAAGTRHAAAVVTYTAASAFIQTVVQVVVDEESMKAMVGVLAVLWAVLAVTGTILGDGAERTRGDYTAILDGSDSGDQSA
ncbi:Reduced folate carrier [Carpediemonas membranifera]|uniref:Reduced folate carrier n=1 Tax=Carpediemonas membranifera TaxID=201153 RepID=A0A8J6E1Q7_9EUKA|nr:Reduced folate carrier [Carpediemonas membranifera]|eukprot:KAG9393356.1 Reduced folate carrier [Carpediemonas membranifera]